MDKQQLEAIRARDADDYAAADVLRNIRSAGNTDPELEATINMIADRRDLLAAYDALAARLAEARCVCDEQATDAGLWFMAERVTEAYLQAALRRLHAAVEGTADSASHRENEDHG